MLVHTLGAADKKTMNKIMTIYLKPSNAGNEDLFSYYIEFLYAEVTSFLENLHSGLDSVIHTGVATALG